MKYPYTLPNLNYNFTDLEVAIDALTMEIHYTKHHQTYIDKLNKALESHTDLHRKPLKELLINIHELPVDIQTAVRNNGGGHLNHSFFWEILAAEKSEAPAELAEAINKTFESFDKFKKAFAEAALNRFGSGWAWLVKNNEGKLEICSTPNQDNPIMDGKTPILGLDVWEHAYYLRYQNKRSEYIENFWNVVNWAKVEELYNS